MKIGCVILAGGKSSRMGSDKALLELNGEKFIVRLMEELRDFDEKLIARGENQSVSNDDWLEIPDIYQERGPIGGLHSALRKCKSEALFCVTCDMPFFQKKLADQICAELDDTCDAVIVETEDGRKHPLCGIYRKTAVEVFEKQILSNNNRMMAALDQMRVKVICLDTGFFAHQLKNINTPEEFLESQNL